MPVRKLRDVSEMEETLWYEPGGEALTLAIKRVWELAARTCPQHFPPGVYRHRSLASAQRLKEEWARQNFEAFQQRRGG